jgi:hypothetical protein
MGPVRGVKVAALEFLRGRALEAVGGGLVNQGGQQDAFAIRKRQDELLGSV